MCTDLDEIASCFTAMCLCPLHLLLMWTNENKPHGSGGVTWPSSRGGPIGLR
jgi:hypothetical protein